MKNLLTNNNRPVALITILVLVVGSISTVVTTHVATASQIGKLCVFFACGNANITGGTQSSSGGSQPSPTTGILTVTKEISDPLNRCGITGSSECSPGDFTIKVTGNNPSLASFPGSATGTKVTLGPGQYEVSETGPITRSPSFSGNCIQVGNTASATGTIVAGGTQNCTITNDVS